MMDTDPVTPSSLESDQDSQSGPQASSASAPEGDTIPPPLPEFRREKAVAPFAEIFAGPRGLYPATRWLIYVGVTFLILGFENSLLAGIHFAGGQPAWWGLVREGRMMLAAFLPGFLMAYVEGRPFGSFGLPAPGAFGRHFWVGALWGIVSLSVLMLALRLLGVFWVGGLNVQGARALKFALYYAVFFLVTGLFEEFLVRGYSQWVLAKSMGYWPAAAVLSLLFGGLHLANPGEARVGIAAVVAIGFFFCLSLRRTGTLWWAVGFHMSWDWGESFLYSVPDSGNLAHGRLLNSWVHGPDWLTGGSVGPEGSYLVFVLIAILWVVFSRAYPEIRYVPHQE